MAASTSLTLLFVDSNVPNYQWLIDNRKPDAEVVVLNADRDGITQITEYLAGQRQVGSAQIISHGARGSLQLGSTTLTAENLDTYAAQIQSWSKALTENADILLLGCNVAADERGKAFVQAIAHLTGADLAASTNVTGDATQGGDWVLEYTTGTIESTIAIQSQGLAQYNSVLAAFGSGNLVVLRVGDGVNYGNRMAPVFLDEYTTTGQLVQTITIPTVDDPATGNQGLTLPSTRYSTGMLALSADGQYLTFGGWDQPVGAFSGSSGWVIGVVNGGGIVDTTTLIPANPVTSLGDLTTVVSPDGVRFWMGTTNTNGTVGGIRYGTYGSQTTTNVVQSIDIRSLEIVDGQLYASSDLNGFRPVDVIGTGLPTTATTYQALPGLQGIQANVGLRNPQEFVFLDLNAGVQGLDTLYVTTLNGISKFSFNGTVWTYRNVFNPPDNNDWLGLTVSTSAAGVDLYAVQANRLNPASAELVRVTDTAAFNANFAPSNFQSLVISAANTTFRGLSFTPSLPSVRVQGLDGTALETGVANTASFRVERTSIAGTMTVELALSGTAGANDYTVSGGAIANGILTVSIPPGQTFVDVVLTAVVDGEVEVDETFTVTLNSHSTYLITPGANTGTLTIIDNRLPNGVPDSYMVLEDGTLTVNVLNGVLANDVDLDGNSLTVSRLVSDVSSGRLILNPDGSFTYTPNANFSGVDQFTYEVTDRYGEVGPVTVTLNVTPQPDAPVAVADQYSVNEDGVLTVDAAAGVLQNDSDVDGNPLTAVLTDDVDNGTLTLNANGSFTYTPDGDFSGTDSFSYQVNDGTGLTSNIVTVQLTVNAVPDAPVAVADQYSVDEDGVLTVSALAGLLVNDRDADGNPLSAVLTDDVDNGTLTLNPDGSFTYTPIADYNGTDSFSYRVTDGTGLSSDVVTVQLTVNPVADVPLALPDQYRLDEDTVLTVTVPDGILSNDRDADGDVITVQLVDNVANGVLNLASDGSFTYAPNTDFNGVDRFTYQATDGSGQSNVVTVELLVGDVSETPLSEADRYTTVAGSLLQVNAAIGVLSNDQDVENDPLTARLVTGPANGTLTLNANGSFNYRPNNGFQGVDQFTYQANDGTSSSQPTTVTIDVTPANTAPQVRQPIVDQVAWEDRAYVFRIPANAFVDPEGDRLTYRARLSNGSALPQWLRFNGTTGRFAGTPGNANIGTLQVRVFATDTSGATTSDLFRLRINNTNDAPRLSRSPANFSALVGRRFSLRLPGNTFVDEDRGDRLSYQAQLSNGRALPAWLRFDPRNLSFQGLPPVASEGAYSVRLIARDRQGSPAFSSFTLRVRSNNTPVAMPNPTNIIWGTEFNDSDSVRGTAVGDRIDALGRHDYIRGFGGDDVLLGRAGNDVLDGGVGNDWLLGGAGNDTHYGNAGRDVFVLASGEGTDWIADFEKGSDRIGLSGGISFANLQIVQGDGAAELRLNNEVLARLNGIQANTLTSSDFVSVQAS